MEFKTNQKCFQVFRFPKIEKVLMETKYNIIKYLGLRTCLR